jgi:hypothetical protein
MGGGDTRLGTQNLKKGRGFEATVLFSLDFRFKAWGYKEMLSILADQ